jgi:hypothetical protein
LACGGSIIHVSVIDPRNNPSILDGTCLPCTGPGR